MAHFIKEGKMISNKVDTYLANAKMVDSDGEIEVYNGSLVVLGDLLEDKTYEATGHEYDAYEASAPAAATDEVAIVDYAGINEVGDGHNSYYMGINLYDLKVPAGKLTRVRRLGLHDKFWLAAGNFDAAPTVGKFATAEANKFTHKAATALPESGYAVKILDSKAVVTGMKDEGLMYLVEVVQL